MRRQPILLLGISLGVLLLTFVDFAHIAQEFSRQWSAFATLCTTPVGALGGYLLHLDTIFTLSLLGILGISFIRGILFVIFQLLKIYRIQAEFKSGGFPYTSNHTGRIYIVNDDRPFALTVGFIRPVIYLSQGLIHMLSNHELEAVIVHEKYHQEHFHPLRLLLLNTIRVVLFYAPVFKSISEYTAVSYEVSADKASMNTTSRSILASAILKTVQHTQWLSPAPLCTAGFSFIPERVNALDQPAQRLRLTIPKLYLALSLLSIVFITPSLAILFSVHAHAQIAKQDFTSTTAQDAFCQMLMQTPMPLMSAIESELNMTPNLQNE